MDRAISKRRRWSRAIRRTCLALGTVGACGAVAIWGFDLLQPRLQASDVRISAVDAGALESMVVTSGTVLPEIERVISSPIATRVVSVLKKAGSPVQAGEAIVELDTSETRLTVQTIERQLELKRNEQRLTELELQEELISVNGQIEMAQLELDLRNSDFERMTRLFEEKLVSRSDLDQSRAEGSKARVALGQSQAQADQARQRTGTRLRGLELELEVLEKELEEARRQAQLATTKSDREGIITWIISEEGAAVEKGALLARVADLGSFFVKATVSDVYADRMSPGLPVIVQANGSELAGSVQRILPTISDGIMTLIVSLEAPSSPLLRSNLRVDVRIILDSKPRVLRLRRGPGIRENADQDVWVIRGSEAVKTSVVLGASNFEMVEVVTGLKEGDRVIVSDMSGYEHMNSVHFNQPAGRW